MEPSSELNNQKAYIQEHNRSYRSVSLTACIIVLTAFVVFSIWDASVIGWDHPRIMDFLLYRHLVGDPLVIATMYFCFQKTTQIRLDWLMTVNLVLVANSILIIYILMFEIGRIPEIEGILVFILGSLFLPSIFYYQKMIVCLFSIISYVAILIAYDQGMQNYLHGAIYLSIIAIAGIVHSIAFDRKSKSNFDKNNMLQNLAHTDQLTGTENRHKFDEHFHLLLDTAAQEAQPFALGIIDIDYFKQYNDHYGHLAGDECLVQVAHALSKLKSHKEDRIVRFGGEEFIVVKYGLAENELEDWAQKVPQGIRELAIPHQASEQNHYVTISAGISYWTPENPKSRRQLMSEADEALYKAKSNGRNQSILSIDGE